MAGRDNGVAKPQSWRNRGIEQRHVQQGTQARCAMLQKPALNRYRRGKIKAGITVQHFEQRGECDLFAKKGEALAVGAMGDRVAVLRRHHDGIDGLTIVVLNQTPAQRFVASCGDFYERPMADKTAQHNGLATRHNFSFETSAINVVALSDFDHGYGRSMAPNRPAGTSVKP